MKIDLTNRAYWKDKVGLAMEFYAHKLSQYQSKRMDEIKEADLWPWYKKLFVEKPSSSPSFFGEYDWWSAQDKMEFLVMVDRMLDSKGTGDISLEENEYRRLERIVEDRKVRRFALER